MQNQQYHPLAKYLHWIIAAMVVLQFVLANAAESAGSDRLQSAILANHKSVGITIFVLALLRLTWRLRQGVPRPMPMPEWQLTASQISHWSMYALIFLLPVTGWLTSSASGSSASWFNLIDLPDLVAPDSGTAETLQEIHELHATLLLAIAVLHIAAAAWHALNKQPVFMRVTSTGPVVIFIAIIAVGSLTLARGGDSARTAIRDNGPSTTTPGTTAISVEAWRIDHAASFIRFTGSQAGIVVSGEWQEWRGDIRFDDARLNNSLIDVSVIVASVETLDDERDTVLQKSEWFDGKNHPEIRFVANRFVRSIDGRFKASGGLTLKGRRTPASLDFMVSKNNRIYVLDGKMELDRLALDLGLGEFSDTRWIGRIVTVNIHVEATATD